MTQASVDEIKSGLRQAAHSARAALSADYRKDAAGAVASHFLSSRSFSSTQTVAGYWAIRDELDCRPILNSLLASARKVILPVVTGQHQPLDLRVWVAGVALEKAGFGTFGPPTDAPRAIPDVLLMPLLAFDKTGTRLGYGGGYYDRTLASLPKKPQLIGLAFAVQEFDEIPRLDHDVPLDAVITETGLRMFGDTL
jgi:5-formyltetrahydrofolate cyclo-ligase